MSAPIPNKQLVPQTRLTYTVGPVITGARFTTIQGAITRAIADGANPNNPAVVIILTGLYIENLTITGGGISLAGLSDSNETFIQGNISFANDAALGGFHGISNCYVVGQISVSGASAATAVITINNTIVIGDITVTGPSSTVYIINSSDVTAVSGEAINAAGTTVFVYHSRVITAATDRVILASIVVLVGATLTGRCEVVGGAFGAFTSQDTTISVTAQEAVTLTNLTTTSFIYRTTFARVGAAGQVATINSPASNFLFVDVTVIGSGSSAAIPIVVTAASGVTYGTKVDPRIGSYSFPQSSVSLFTMPSADGVAGRALVTNGAGVLSLGLVTTPTTALTEGISAALNWTTTHRYRLTMTGNVAISVTNPPGSCSLLLELVQDGTGGWIPTLPSSFRGDTSDEIPVQVAANAVTLWALSFNSTTGLYTVSAFSAGTTAATAVGV